VIPVIESLAGKINVPISIDPSKANVAKEAVAAGAEIINDVTGLEGDANMPAVAVESEVGICVMHMRGTPQTMQDDPQYDNVVEEIYSYLQQRLQACIGHGIAKDRICLDPGIGFGKTHLHNLQLLAGCHRFTELGSPILVGHSRKGFMAKLLGDKEADRTAATIGTSLALAMSGIQILRVHDVRPIREALMLFEACGGI